jgi:hypothetical protein
LWIVPTRELTVVALADRDRRLGHALLEPLLLTGPGAVRK